MKPRRDRHVRLFLGGSLIVWIGVAGVPSAVQRLMPVRRVDPAIETVVVRVFDRQGARLGCVVETWGIDAATATRLGRLSSVHTDGLGEATVRITRPCLIDVSLSTGERISRRIVDGPADMVEIQVPCESVTMESARIPIRDGRGRPVPSHVVFQLIGTDADVECEARLGHLEAVPREPFDLLVEPTDARYAPMHLHALRSGSIELPLVREAVAQIVEAYDANTHEPIAGMSVQVLGPCGHVLELAVTGDDGRASVRAVPGVANDVVLTDLRSAGPSRPQLRRTIGGGDGILRVAMPGCDPHDGAGRRPICDLPGCEPRGAIPAAATPVMLELRLPGLHGATVEVSRRGCPLSVISVDDGAQANLELPFAETGSDLVVRVTPRFDQPFAATKAICRWDGSTARLAPVTLHAPPAILVTGAVLDRAAWRVESWYDEDPGPSQAAGRQLGPVDVAPIHDDGSFVVRARPGGRLLVISTRGAVIADGSVPPVAADPVIRVSPSVGETPDGERVELVLGGLRLGDLTLPTHDLIRFVAGGVPALDAVRRLREFEAQSFCAPITTRAIGLDEERGTLKLPLGAFPGLSRIEVALRTRLAALAESRDAVAVDLLLVGRLVLLAGEPEGRAIGRILPPLIEFVDTRLAAATESAGCGLLAGVLADQRPGPPLAAPRLAEPCPTVHLEDALCELSLARRIVERATAYDLPCLAAGDALAALLQCAEGQLQATDDRTGSTRRQSAALAVFLAIACIEDTGDPFVRSALAAELRPRLWLAWSYCVE